MKPFKGLPLDLFGFEIVELKDFEPSFANAATPDWVLYLAAAARGLTGVITNDVSQLSQYNEVRALELTRIAVVTYRKGVTDELTKWGQLMAYSPRIVRQLDKGQRGGLIIPAPGSVDHQPSGSLLRAIRQREKARGDERLERFDQAMRVVLARMKRPELWPGSREEENE